MIDLDALSQTYEGLFEFQIKEVLPMNDTKQARFLFKFLKQFYSKFSIDMISQRFCVILFDSDLDSMGLDKTNAVNCTIGRVHEIIKFPAIVQLKSNSSVLVWNNYNIELDAKKEPNAIIYEYNEYEESITVGEGKVLAPKSCASSKSIFALPTYLDLESALDHYYRDNAKYSVCNIIQRAWYDDRRLRWKAGPEHLLRDSLLQYLRASLRTAADILKEQNVSEDNPIDIKVIWQNTTERALIEIKWLGVSFKENGEKTANYSTFRIKTGSKQLIDYIDEAYEQTPTAHFKGYLVIFDGRRRMVDTDERLIKHNKEHSIYYRDKDDSKYINSKFTEKNCIFKRFFMEPILEVRSFSN